MDVPVCSLYLQVDIINGKSLHFQIQSCQRVIHDHQRRSDGNRIPFVDEDFLNDLIFGDINILNQVGGHDAVRGIIFPHWNGNG